MVFGDTEIYLMRDIREKDTGMKTPATVLLYLAVGLTVFCGVFLWNPPAPRFHPVERVWRMPTNAAKGPAMGWYGRTGAALGAATITGGITAAVLRLWNRKKQLELNPATIYAIAFALVLCFAITFAGIVHEQKSWFSKAPTVPKPDHEY